MLKIFKIQTPLVKATMRFLLIPAWGLDLVTTVRKLIMPCQTERELEMHCMRIAVL